MATSSSDVFRALADVSRRHLLDLLRGRDGRTLGELAAELDMTRQSATQHLAVLESANLVSAVRHGRRKLHYLNPVPLHEFTGRWLTTFDHPRLAALAQVRHRAEESTMTGHPTRAEETRPDFRYVTFIRATREAVWRALTDADLTASYWGHSTVSDWRVGSGWERRRTDGSGLTDVVGTVLESDPPRRLSITFADPDASPDAAEPSVVTFEVDAFREIVRLTVTHLRLPSEDDRAEAARGWSSVLSNLKTLLETGSVLPQAPWQMPVDVREEQVATR